MLILDYTIMDKKIKLNMIITVTAFTVLWLFLGFFRIKLLEEHVYSLAKNEAKSALEFRSSFLENDTESITKLTSLKFLNPINAPSSWERKYLMEFDKGNFLQGKFEMKDNDKFKAIMPLEAKKSCLTCHENYKVGEIRGGVSIEVPMDKFSCFKDREFRNILINRAVIYLLAVFFIIILFKVINKYFDEKVKANNETELFISGPIVVFKWIATDNWPVEYVSRNVVPILGYSVEEWLSAKIKFSEIIHPDDLEKVFEEVMFYSENKNRNSFEQWYRLIKKDKTIINIYDKTTIIRDENGVITHYYGYILDITEQEKMKIEINRLKNLESLGIIAGGMAHNFNNLLAILQGNIDFNYKNKLDETSIIDDTISKLAALSNKMLVFSKGGNPVKEDVRDFCIFIENYINKLILNKEVSLEFKAIEHSFRLKIDKKMMELTIKNIVLNSLEAFDIKKNKDKKIKFIVEVIANYKRCIYNNHNKHIKLTISDNASGINNNDIQKVLLPYYTSKINHIGLGLSIAHSIIEKHEGRLEINSVEGKGTDIIIYLPILNEESYIGDNKNNSSYNFTKVDANNKLDIAPKTVLIMDDEELILKMMKKTLEANGFKVETSTHGKDAIDKYNKEYKNKTAFSLVILDLIIPEAMGGEETMSEIFKINKNAKIIVSSGYSNSDIISNYKSYGVKEVLPKPYKLNELLDLVNKVLDS